MAGSDDFDLWRQVLQLGTSMAGSIVASTLSLMIFEIFHGSNLALSLIRDRRDARIVEVLMFEQNVPLGAIIEETDLTVRPFPKVLLPEEAILDRRVVVGRTLKEPALAGDLVRKERLADFDGEGIDALVPPGMRALMLDLDSASHVSGSVRPGDYVDLIYTMPYGETLTLSQSVPVLAADERVRISAMGYEIYTSQVTVTLDPEEVQKVAHVLTLGKERLRLTLVGAEESSQLPEVASAPDAEHKPIGASQMSPAEFRRTFDEGSVEAMYRAVEGGDEEPLPVVDATLVRQVSLPEGLKVLERPQ